MSYKATISYDFKNKYFKFGSRVMQGIQQFLTTFVICPDLMWLKKYYFHLSLPHIYTIFIICKSKQAMSIVVKYVISQDLLLAQHKLVLFNHTQKKLPRKICQFIYLFLYYYLLVGGVGGFSASWAT